ncbi:MAG: maleylpyruvate isomerase family mycothiol-dependent enzyme [Mycobacteriaceae bacterium]|nr:maleylpyruvate isomerase family mycothiol-dependent enzyme [Mycobacteriaceae bacterium]
MSVRDMLRSNDERFRTLAAGLGPDEWARPSLCDEWTNHEVLAHLVIGYRLRAVGMMREILSYGGSFDRANTAMAGALAAARGPTELLDEFGELVGRPRGLGRIFPPQLLLGDHITHELDILFALDREPKIPRDAVVAVLNTQVALPNPFVPAFRNSRRLRLRATDVDWGHGDNGPLVEGRGIELLSVLGSRPRMLSALRGDGVELLASRISPSRIRRGG